MSLTEEKVLKVLEGVKIPGAPLSIAEQKSVGKIEIQEKSLLVEVILKEPNPLVEKSLRFQIQNAIEKIASGTQVATEFRVVVSQTTSVTPSIGSILAVGSGKGGVGKSAVSVNLAISLRDLGYQVGLLDCDIYGPSIPWMMGVADKKPMMLDGKIQPVEAHGLKIMSTGFLVEPGQSLVWRGPMIHKLIQQFFQDVSWGDTDVLIVDLPPGTGDAPLSLSQVMPLTGAVMVSMPQKVSLLDVHKGVSMFHQVKVPILGAIENMSHFVCSSCSHEEEIFDRGGVKKFCEEIQIPYLGDIPIDGKIREASDSGLPFVLKYPNRPAAEAFRRIAKQLRPFLRTQEDLSVASGDLKIVL